jgi:hypothetical protein
MHFSGRGELRQYQDADAATPINDAAPQRCSLPGNYRAAAREQRAATLIGASRPMYSAKPRSTPIWGV